MRLLHPAIHLVIATLILAIGLRTWLVMGLIEPVAVVGSSMAPAVQGGDRLWIDRTADLWHHPNRWDIVVARNPTGDTELCIKRIVGLPNERVCLRAGNVLADGVVVVKSLAERHALRQVVHREAVGNVSDRRWQSDIASTWQPSGSGWQHHVRHGSSGSVGWLSYQHPQPITDDVSCNVGLTRRLNLVDEFMLAAKLRAQGTGILSLAIDDGTSTAQVDLRLPDGKLTWIDSEQARFAKQLSEQSRKRLARGQAVIELSNFDDQLLVLIDGHVELQRPWPKTKAAGTARPFSVGAQGLDVWIGGLTLYRDTFHSHHAAGVLPPTPAQWQLGPNEYFLLGDNAPVSLDSRLWGPVSGRLFVGKPLLP